MIKRYLIIFLSLVFFLNFLPPLKAELILAEGIVRIFSCSKINDKLFLLYSRDETNFGDIFLKEFDCNWGQIQERRLGINGASAYPAYFNNRFYVSYTSFEKEGNVRIAEFDLNWNLLRDILVTPTPYDGEIAYGLIPMDDERFYLFYARNWVNDCGLKMVEFNRYLEPVREATLISGDVDFHANQASDFSIVFANNHIYIAYKRYTHPKNKEDEEIINYRLSELYEEFEQLQSEIEDLETTKEVILKKLDLSQTERDELNAIENTLREKNLRLDELGREIPRLEGERGISMDIFVDEYALNGELIQERSIDWREKLSPSLFFDNGRFYITYDGYDYNINKPIIYIRQYDINWNLLNKTNIHMPETGMPREKTIIFSEGRCYLISKTMQKIFAKEINFDLKEDKVKL